MQTFLPDQDYVESAQSLDTVRLAKQLVECYQILLVLTELAPDLSHRNPGGWRNHPAVEMWRGHEGSLVSYAWAVADELMINRPKKDGSTRKTETMGKIHRVYQAYEDRMDEAGKASAAAMSFNDPHWLGDERLHLSHRIALLRKAPEHYGELWGAAASEWPNEWPAITSDFTYTYWWPTRGWGKESSVLKP